MKPAQKDITILQPVKFRTFAEFCKQKKQSKNIKIISTAIFCFAAITFFAFVLHIDTGDITGLAINNQQIIPSQNFSEVQQTTEKSAEIITAEIQNSLLSMISASAGIIALILGIIALIHAGIEKYHLSQQPFIESQEFITATKWAAKKIETMPKEKILVALLDTGLTQEQIKLVITATKLIRKK